MRLIKTCTWIQLKKLVTVYLCLNPEHHQDAPDFAKQSGVVDACLEAQERKINKQDIGMKKEYVHIRVKIPPSGSVPGRREQEVRHREVLCGVP